MLKFNGIHFLFWEDSMRKKSLIIIFIMLIILYSCENAETSVPIESRKPDNSVPDITFTYEEYIPKPSEGIIYNATYAINENYLVYYHIEDKAIQYGFMDLEFNKITKAISRNEPHFYNDVACIITIDPMDNKIIHNVYDKDMTLLEIDGKNPFMYDGLWLSCENIIITSRTIGAYIGQELGIWRERKMNFYKIFTDSKFGDIDIYDTLIPVKSDKGLYGYKTFADVYIYDVTGDDGYQIPPIYERVHDFSEGLAVVRMDEKYGYINMNGIIVIPCQYSGAREFSNGIAQVEQIDEETDFENITWSLIDSEGYAISDSKYAVIREYREGFASAGKYSTINGGVLLDENGKEHFADQFRIAWGFVDGISLVQNAYGDYYYIDKNGYNINGEKYEDAEEFSDGLAVVGKNGKYGYIGKDGLIQIERIYEYATSFNSGFAVVRLPGDSLSFVIDKMGNKYLEELDLDGLSQFNEGGYALGYSIVDDEGNRIYYLIHME